MVVGDLMNTEWEKIAVHPSGFGRYSLPDTNYPKTEEECEKIIKDFDKWFKLSNQIKDCYRVVILK